MKQLTILLLAFVFLFTSCNTREAGASDKNDKDVAAFDLDAARTEIIGSYEAFNKAASAGDSATLRDMYHSGAIGYPPNMPAIKEREGIAGYFASMPKMGIKSIKTQTGDVFGGPTDVIETGTYELSDGTNTLDKGKYIVIWRQEDGKWKNYRDIWNSDMPPPPAKK